MAPAPWTVATSSAGGVWPARRPPISYLAHQSPYCRAVIRHLRDRAGSPWRVRMMAPGRVATKAPTEGAAVGGTTDGSVESRDRAGTDITSGRTFGIKALTS